MISLHCLSSLRSEKSGLIFGFFRMIEIVMDSDKGAFTNHVDHFLEILLYMRYSVMWTFWNPQPGPHNLYMPPNRNPVPKHNQEMNLAQVLNKVFLNYSSNFWSFLMIFTKIDSSFDLFH